MPFLSLSCSFSFLLISKSKRQSFVGMRMDLRPRAQFCVLLGCCPKFLLAFGFTWSNPQHSVNTFCRGAEMFTTLVRGCDLKHFTQIELRCVIFTCYHLHVGSYKINPSADYALCRPMDPRHFYSRTRGTVLQADFQQDPTHRPGT